MSKNMKEEYGVFYHHILPPEHRTYWIGTLTADKSACMKVTKRISGMGEDARQRAVNALFRIRKKAYEMQNKKRKRKP